MSRNQRPKSAGDGPPVPITMGSPRFESVETGPFRVTRASFVGHDVLAAHTHDRTTFGVMLSGGFDVGFTNAALGKRSHACVAGSVFTEPLAERHANRIGPEGASVLVIQPDPEGETMRMFGPLLDAVHCFRHDGLARTARRIARELEAPDSLTPLAVHAQVLETLVWATRAVDAGARRPKGRPGWLRVVEEMIDDRFRDALRVDDFAREAGVSTSHLAAVFRETHGTSLGAALRGRRVEWAADQLATTDGSIASIALRAGFADQAHMTRVFKRRTGRTPGQWRSARRRVRGADPEAWEVGNPDRG